MPLQTRRSLSTSLLCSLGVSLAFLTVGCGSDADPKTAATSGTSGTSGSSGASGTAGSAGTAGASAGTAGAGATGGDAGTAGIAGTGGSAATGGDGGTGGTGGASGASGTAGVAGTSGASGASTDYPAMHQDAPTAENSGGHVMAAPKAYPVYFANDDTLVTNKLTEFFNGMGTFMVGDATYWSAVTSEYGVGPLTVGAPITVTDMPTGTIDDADIQTWLAAKFNTNDPAFPVPDDNTIMALVYPSGVTISLGGEESCVTFGGYHQEIQLDAAHQNKLVSYAVLPRCPGDPFSAQLGVTAAASHELIEAATDPDPNYDAAYQSVDSAHRGWARTLGGGEVGDLCAQNPGAFVEFDGFDFPVQRSWSNVSAAASHDPCVPVDPNGGSYFNSVPVLDDVTITFGGGGGGGGQMTVIKAVQIPVGTSKTIDIQLFSDGPVDSPWKVKAIDAQDLVGQPSLLSFAFEDGVDSGMNGDILHLTITMDTAPQHSTANFLLVSSRAGINNLWVGSVAKLESML